MYLCRVILGFTLPVHACRCLSVLLLSLLLWLRLVGMRSRQLKETRRSPAVLTPLDLAQGVYDNFEEPPVGIKL